MKKKQYDEFDTIDDYYEDEGDNFFSQTIGSDLSDVRYEDFNKVNDYDDDYDEDDDTEEITTKTTHKKRTSSSNSLIQNEGLMDFLSFFWTWFRRLGIVIAVILIAYFLTKGMFKDLFLYILLLVASFFFGFGFMAVINKVMENK